MFKYTLILATSEVGLLLMVLLYELITGTITPLNMINFLYQFFITMVGVILFIVGRRFRQYYNHIIAGFYIVCQLICALMIDLLITNENSGPIMIVKVIGYMLVFTLLLASSARYVAIYSLVYSINII